MRFLRSFQVLCHGLTLPMTEYETVRECVNIYCEWLMCLTSPKKCVPIPILEDPNSYSQDILKHLFNIFVPRHDQGWHLNKPYFDIYICRAGLK